MACGKDETQQVVLMKKTAADFKIDIEAYDKAALKWTESSKKIIQRYKDERNSRSQANRYNILWSNIQTLLPSLFNKNPKPNVERRFLSDDPLGSVASQVLERCIEYFVDSHDFYHMMRQVTLDRLLPGRGTAWVRYVPKFGNSEVELEGLQVTDDSYVEPEPVFMGEEVVLDYVHWQDFGHSWGRTWEEVDAVWRRVYLGREELEERFGKDKAKDVPLDYEAKTSKGDIVEQISKKACVYEIWCKSTGYVYWLHKEMPDFLDMKPDPLGLKGFFPCPRPLFSTVANDSCIPVPDYDEYRDQANELDLMTAKIMSLTKALKVAGVYDSSAKGLERLLVEGVENQLIPVENWAALTEQGGLAGVVSYLPLDQVTNTLLALYQTRDKTKQDLYEITGISDIIRGATSASETATAQEIKGRFASMRLDAMQGDVAKFMRDLVQIMGEIIAEHFSMETIKELSGVKLMTMQEKQQIQMQQQMAQYAAQQAQAMGQQPPPPPPIDPKTQELMAKPSWEDVIDLLRNDLLRGFRIDVQTDSTIKADQAEERDARIQFLQSVGGFMQQAMQIQNADLMPLLLQMMKFGMQGFKVGKDIEGTFETVMDNMMKPKPPPEMQPDPALLADIESKKVELSVKAQDNAAKLDLEKQKLEMENALEQQRVALEAKRIEMESYFKNMELSLKMRENELKQVEEIKEPEEPEESEGLKQEIDILAVVKEMMEQFSNGMAQIAESVSKPRQVTAQRDKTGKIIGAISEQASL